MSNSFSKLVPYEEPNINKLQDKNKLKLIKFYKIPQKILGEEEEFLFEDESKEKNKKEINNIKSKNNSKIKLREIKTLKYNKKSKIFFNLNYRNVYDCINELYLPLMQNIESINSILAEHFDNYKEYIDKIPTLPAKDSLTFAVIRNICEPVR